MAPSNGSRTPHMLRFSIFLLRIGLGLNLFYLGLSTLFEPSLRGEFRGRSLGDLYLWLANVPSASSLQTIFAWAFLVIGACLILGLATRLVTILGMALVATSLFPTLSYATLNVSKFVTDGIIAILCLLVLFMANAGTYLGFDHFIHFGRHHAEN